MRTVIIFEIFFRIPHGPLALLTLRCWTAEWVEIFLILCLFVGLWYEMWCCFSLWGKAVLLFVHNRTRAAAAASHKCEIRMEDAPLCLTALRIPVQNKQDRVTEDTWLYCSAGDSFCPKVSTAARKWRHAYILKKERDHQILWFKVQVIQ